MATGKTRTVPFLRVEAPSSTERVEAAGLHWAGVSEVPLATLSALQVQQLKGDERLKVSDTERPAEADAA